MGVAEANFGVAKQDNDNAARYNHFFIFIVIFPVLYANVRIWIKCGKVQVPPASQLIIQALPLFACYRGAIYKTARAHPLPDQF